MRIRPAAGATVRAAHVATAAIFFCHGAGFAGWLARIPAAQRSLDLSEAALGLALLGAGLGAVLVMPVAGWASARTGSRRVTRVGAVLAPAAVILPAVATSAGTLFAALLVLGAAHGALDVAMNDQGVTVEKRGGRPVLSGLHGLWSLGAMAGSGAGGLAAAAQVPLAVHLTLAAVVLALGGVLAGRFLLPAEPESRGGPGFARPTRALAVLAGMAFVALLAEGAVADWSAVYLHSETAAGPGLAAAGYACFSLCMAAGRFGGDRLVGRLGPVTVVRGGAALATVGMTVAVALPRAPAVLAGFALVGAGLSCLAPLLFGAAARAGQAPALAAVTTSGYLGFLLGSPTIGLVADVSSLRVSLAGVALMTAAVVPRAGAVRSAAVAPAPVTRVD